jgi:hypothetical protein
MVSSTRTWTIVVVVAKAVSLMDEIHCISRARHKQRSVRFTGLHVCPLEAYYYTFSETDLSVIRQHRGPANRLGFAVQLCYLRFPGVILSADESPFPPLLRVVASQLKVPVESWNDYGQREQTRREHLVELQTVFGFRPCIMSHYRQAGFMPGIPNVAGRTRYHRCPDERSPFRAGRVSNSVEGLKRNSCGQ